MNRLRIIKELQFFAIALFGYSIVYFLLMWTIEEQQSVRTYLQGGIIGLLVAYILRVIRLVMKKME